MHDTCLKPLNGTLLGMLFRLQATVAKLLLATACVFVPAARSRAAEMVTLRNGFTLTCLSREAVSPGTIRLHLRADDAALENYLDVPLASIAAVEALSDAVPESHPAPLVPKTKAEDVRSLAQQSGETHNVNAALLMAVIHAESAGNAHAVSRAGARGLMQLMPGTARPLGVADSFSAEGNVDGGSTYLDSLLTRYHDNVALALAAYNAGPAAVDRCHGIPPYRETRLYVARVIQKWNSLVIDQHEPSARQQVLPR